MKIALVAPVEETIPPRKYGGTEWIVYQLAEGLGKKGHLVELFASGDSPTSEAYKIIPVTKTALRTDPLVSENLKLRESKKLLAVSQTIEYIQSNHYDLIHNHAGWRFLAFGNLFNIPIVTTHHMPLSYDYQSIIFQGFKNLPHISISNNQRKDFPDLNFVATVYNGTIMSSFPYLEYSEKHEKDPYMIYLARMSEEKGALEAVQATIQAGKKLVVAAKIDEVNKPYYAKFQELIPNEHINFIGEIGPEDKLTYLQNARALLVPIKWEEPFGLMFTESMFSGTPIITFSRGSAPEIIKDGFTGFLVNQSDEFKNGDWIIKKTGIDGLREAIDRIHSMPKDQYIQMRKNSRKHAEENFTSDRMVNEYEAIYQKIISNE